METSELGSASLSTEPVYVDPGQNIRMRGACPYCYTDIPDLTHLVYVDPDGNMDAATGGTTELRGAPVQPDERISCPTCARGHLAYDEMTVSLVCVNADTETFSGNTGLS